MNDPTLLLMRHGDYDPFFNNLTDNGCKQVAAIAEEMLQSGFIPDVILASPVQRTQETAQIVADVFNRVAGKNVQVITAPALADRETTSESDVRGLLADHPQAKTFLLVTHEPNIIILSKTFNHAIKPEKAEVNIFQLHASSADWVKAFIPAPAA